MIYLAYDGSINSDWVAWYALNMAQHDQDARLTLLHVETREFDTALIQAKAAELARECELVGVTMDFVALPSMGASVHQVSGVLREAIAASPQALLVCGARLKGGGRGYLAGTVSEKLLSDGSVSVMALRVVQPGLLGAPSRFLMPVAGDRQGFLAGAHILKRFGPGVMRVHLLRVMQLKRQFFRHLQLEQAQKLRDKGWELMRGLDDELAELIGIDTWKTDVQVAVSDDWAHEVIISAGRHKAHLILMEASQNDLGAGYLYGNAIEVVLRDAPCDVAIYRGA